MEPLIDQLFEALEQPQDDTEAAPRLATLARQLMWMPEPGVECLLNRLCENCERLLLAPGIERSLETVLLPLVQRCQQGNGTPAGNCTGAKRAGQLVRLYHRLPPDWNARNYVLGWLATLSSAVALHEFVRLLIEDPPKNSRGVVLAFGPLLRCGRDSADHLFPGLLDALQHTEVAAGVLDVANHFTRQHGVVPHVAQGRANELTQLLERLVERLEEIDTTAEITAGAAMAAGSVEGQNGSHPSDGYHANGNASAVETDSAVREMREDFRRRVVGQAVPLIVSLCDALALIGHRSCAGTLRRASRLRHRRVRVEAAAALAILGEAEGQRLLIELAQDPSLRQRVLAYARELGIDGQIPEEFKTAESLAEASLAAWLAEPSRVGISPATLELMDRRTLSWPGFDDPVDCFLFRFEYPLADGTVLANVGIVGPMTYAFNANLLHLPVDDIYAAYAGWQAEHDSIYEMSLEQARQRFPAEVEHLQQLLENEEDLEELQPQFLGVMLDQLRLVASARRGGQLGTAIAEDGQVHWIETGGGSSPVTCETAYCIHQGRQLLAVFNPH